MTQTWRQRFADLERRATDAERRLADLEHRQAVTRNELMRLTSKADHQGWELSAIMRELHLSGVYVR